MDRVQTVGIVVLKDNDVLLVCHGEKAGHITGSYGAPGGRIDENETLIHAAVRELEEETGLIAEEKDLIELPEKYDADISRKDGTVMHCHHTVFAVRNFTGELRGTEETEPEWVPIENLSSMELLANTEQMAQQALQYV